MTSTDDRDRPLPASQRVVRAVADEAGTDPMALEPLYTSIDPDCLDRLFAGTSTDVDHRGGFVSFRYAGYRVTVTHDGTVHVLPADAESSTSLSDSLSDSQR